MARAVLALLVLLSSSVAVAGTAAEPSQSDCQAKNIGPAIHLSVTGFKRRAGMINVWIYGSNPSDFLARDKRILRLKYPVPAQGAMQACIAVPAPGNHAIAVHHDVEYNRKRDSTDGIGFSGNPNLSLFRLKPAYADSAVAVGASPRAVNVVLQYRFGLSVRPVAPRRL